MTWPRSSWEDPGGWSDRAALNRTANWNSNKRQPKLVALAWAKLQNHLASMPHTQALNLMEFEATNLSFDRQADTADVRKE